MRRPLALLIGLCFATWLGCIVYWRYFRRPPERTIELHVVDARGAPVERYGWAVRNAEGRRILETIWHSSTSEGEMDRPGGVTEVRCSFERASLEVTCRTVGHARVGPFLSEDLPSVLEVVLDDYEFVEGVVLDRGRPVVGASVELLSEAPDLMESVRSGLLYGVDESRSETDESGRFRIGLDGGRTPYTVAACAPGRALAMVGPALLGGPPVTLELADGGTVEGRVLRAEGRSTNGVLVEAQRTSARVWERPSCVATSAVSDADGNFVIEHLAAGEWLVQLDWTAAPAGTELPRWERLPVAVTVRESERTKLVLDLRSPLLEIDARLRINGRAWDEASATLSMPGVPAWAVDSVHAGDDGAWKLYAREPGRYRITVYGNHKHAIEPRCITGIVEIGPAGLRWDHTFTWKRGDPAEIVLGESELPVAR